MTNEEILEAAKEAGMNKVQGESAMFWYPEIERFAAIIERKTIERLSAGGVLIRLGRPEGYEDVHPELLVEDAIKDGWKWFDILTQQSAN